MIRTAPPVVRCTRVVELSSGEQVPCRGWLVSRALHPEEPPTRALTCSWCAEDYELIAGALVRIARPATPTTLHEMRRERHALAVEAGTIRRRKVEAGT